MHLTKKLVKGNFILRIISKALPTALTVLINIMLVTAFSRIINLSYEVQSSICVILTTITGLMYLYKICKPFTWYTRTLFLTMLSGFVLALTFLPSFFNIHAFNSTILLLVFVLSLDSLYIYKVLNFLVTFIFNKKDKTIEVEKEITI